MNRSTSSARTSGPRSLISVCSPEVGSTTARLVRDSPSIRVKSWRIDSSASCSRMREPVAAAGQPGGDHGPAEQLQGARHVDALAAREGARLDGAMAVPEPEVRDRDRAVDRGIQGDGEDHCGSCLSLLTLVPRRRRVSASAMPITIASGSASGCDPDHGSGPGDGIVQPRYERRARRGERRALAQQRGASGHLAVHGDDGGSEAAPTRDRPLDIARGARPGPERPGRAGL